jgi:hypothetical protein
VQPAVERPFGEVAEPASALVIVGVRDGGRITRDVIDAIAECAGASEAPPDRVRVMSETGRVLFRGGTVVAEEVAQVVSRSASETESGGGNSMWPLIGAVWGSALAVGLLVGFALARGRAGDEMGAEAEAPVGTARPAAAAQQPAPLGGLSAEELAPLIAEERPSVAARLLEAADAETASAVLAALPEGRRAAVARAARREVRPWRPARVALHRAAAAERGRTA